MNTVTEQYNKDFYDDLPGFVCETLEEYIKQYGKSEWFSGAWEEYRKHVKSSSMDDVKMPGYIFNKYVKKTKDIATTTKYRKKPVTIEAFQYDGDLKGTEGYYVPQWAVDAYEKGDIYFREDNGKPAVMFIKTSKGDMLASVGDYIIKGIQGEIYPCKPDIFEQTYEKEDDNSD